MPGIEDIQRNTEARLNAIVAGGREQLRRDMEAIARAWSPELARELAQMPAPTAISLRQMAGEFDAQLAQKYATRAPAPPASPSIPPAAITAQTILGMETRLDNIISQRRSNSLAEALAAPSNFASALREMDDYLTQTLLKEPDTITLPGEHLGANVVFPPTKTAYLDAIATQLGLNVQQRETLKDAPPCVYIPGYGNLASPELLGGAGSAEAAWSQKSAKIAITRALAANRLGRGFIVEFTAFGRLIRQNGWWQIPLRQQLGIAPAPDEMACYAALRDASRFTRSGWRSFITAEMNHRFAEMPARPPNLSELFATIKMAMGAIQFDVLDNPLTRLVFFIFKKILEVSNDEQDSLRLHLAMKALNGVNTRFGAIFKNANDEDLGAIVGRMMINRIEAGTGSTNNIPRAVALALNPANLRVLAQMPASQLADSLGKYPLAHPDARLAMLCMLRHKGLDEPGKLAKLAKSQWRME